MNQRRKPRLTYANVVATLALIVAVGGASAFGATQLAKNSVGSKQLKKNAVTTAKLKNEAVTAAKVKKGTLTGTQINSSTLGIVPNAAHAATADTANAVAASEPFHEVGGPGEPSLQSGWESASEEPVGFYKDREGVVHLAGEAFGGTVGSPIFQLPPGYRPAGNAQVEFAVSCDCKASDPQGGTVSLHTGTVVVKGAQGNPSGLVFLFNADSATRVALNGITFRAES